MKDIYIVLSATSGHMGKFIRKITNTPYNHLSFSFHEDLHEVLSFARYYYSTPFYGGFIHESKERYDHANIKLYKISIDDNSYENIQHFIMEMEEYPHDYYYHTLNALLSPLHKSINIKNAYTCLSFINAILQQSEPMISFYDIQDLMNHLQPYVVFEGTLDTFKLPADLTYIKFIPFHQIIILSFKQNYRILETLIKKIS